MKQQVSVAKWVGLWLLQIPLYLVTSYAMRMLIGSCYRILMRAGANVPPNFLLEHLLWVGFVGGFLAGLIGLLIFRAMMLLPLPSAPRSDPEWKRPQAWTWVLPTFWLAFGMMGWSGGHAHRSVLTTSTSGNGLSLLDAFFGSGCSIPPTIRGYTFLRDCMTQIEFTHPWLGTIGYSVAAFIPSDWFGRLRGSRLTDIDAPEQKHAEQTAEQGHA
jgi:hypothetical protein